MASSNAETHRAAHEAWNRRDFDAIMEMMASSIEYTDHARGLTIRTREDFRGWIQEWAEAFSNGKLVDQEYLEAGDTVVARMTGRGTNDGPFGPFPATGREARFDLCEFLEFDNQGTIVGGDIYYDQLSLLAQLGHVEIPAAATVQP
jgi:steroid delta-isomerase-like uncharacterized protein